MNKGWMKTVFLGIAVVLMLPFAISGTAHAGLNDGLVGYWTFDEGVGIVANDVSGNGNTGSINGATFALGHANTALSFDGTSDVIVPDAPSLNVQSFTLSAWVFPTVVDSDVDIIVNKEAVGPFIIQYEFGIRGTGAPGQGTIPVGNLAFHIGGVGGWLNGWPNDYGGWVDAYGAVPLNAWSHVAITYDGSTAKTFINGVLTRTVSGLSGSVSVSTGPLKIGARSSPILERFNGSIDEVKLYNRALADCEVDRLAGGTGPCLVSAIQSSESPSRQFSMIDTELTQDIVADNTFFPGYGGIGLAWSPNGNLLRRGFNFITEYNLTQDKVVHATPVFSVKTIHYVLGLPGGYGMTNGTDGYIYANSSMGLYRVDPTTWTAVQVAPNGYHYGIGTLPDGRIVNEGTGVSEILIYDPATQMQNHLYTPNSGVDDLTTTSSGYIALALRWAHGVEIIDANGTLINTVPVHGYSGASQPDGMAFGDGSLYTANTDGSISRIDFSGPNFTGTSTEVIVAAGGFYGDLSSVGPDGSFYIHQNGLRYDNGVDVGPSPSHGAWGMVRISRPGGFSTPPGIPVNQPPVADAGVDQSVDCTGASSASVTLDGSLSSDPDGDSLSYTWSGPFGTVMGVSPAVIMPLGVNQAVTLTVDDGNGHTVTDEVLITVQDTTPPTVSAGPDVTIEATGPNGADYDVSAQASASDSCCDVTVTAPALATYSLGDTTVTVSAVDCTGNLASDQMIVNVLDSTPPMVTAQLIPIPQPVDEDEDKDDGEHHAEGLFKVVFTVNDIADANPTVTATLNGQTVSNGQIVKLQRDDEAKAKFEHGQLEIKGMSFTLSVSATDASGNIGSASDAYAFPPKQEHHGDKHHKSKKHDKDD